MKRFTIFTLSILIILLCRCNTTKTADEIHQALLTVDTHADTPMLLTSSDYDLSERHDPNTRVGKIDLPRMKEGGLDGVFFALYAEQGERTPEGNQEAREEALSIFDTIHHVIDRNPDLARLALTSADLEKINSEDKLAIFIGMENGYPVGNDISLVEQYYDLGARYITLCHSGNNDICESSMDADDPAMDGLSEFGEEVVKEMNRLGMIIDVSHMSDESFYDVLATTKAPVMASHSCARAVWDNPRNLSDTMLTALADNGGVIQVCFVTMFVKDQPYPARDSARNEVFEKHGNYYEIPPDKKAEFLKDWYRVDSLYPPRNATVSDFVDHIDHIVNLIGIDYVGIGTDFDGGGELEDCFDVSQLPNITEELINRGYSEEDLKKIWSGNFLRVFSEVERTAGKENAR
ncbi:MAG TPA: dipeptidase [Bacteroidales bacterium]|nr:dipeptidase [Bacteroidales bacterium]